MQRTAPLVKPELAVKKTQIVNIINPNDATKYDGLFSTPSFLRWHNNNGQRELEICTYFFYLNHVPSKYLTLEYYIHTRFVQKVSRLEL